ncbi:ArsR/SmtB family transcription factor [Mesorhizobium muleiense]|uniref:ArsR/SmtB family transcription factor n=1 Tax=Mesorhizobium muleiense TaxID=1004279 RepID=UPI001F1AF5E0|nr:metalloregulator ArsR/SmtB family transcription factor [Mesorhizobium muleiense]MCF6113374.1 metalloregulator ArsR/SmtB family transcription factor [Mesorhizobium muleiense]
MITGSPAQTALDKAFASLGDPTRRAILERLTHEREVAVGDLAERFPTSLTAVIKHIDVLCDAGLVHRQRRGRNVCCSLVPEPMADAQAWLERNLAFWNASFDRLGKIVDGDKA